MGALDDEVAARKMRERQKAATQESSQDAARRSRVQRVMRTLDQLGAVVLQRLESTGGHGMVMVRVKQEKPSRVGRWWGTREVEVQLAAIELGTRNEENADSWLSTGAIYRDHYLLSNNTVASVYNRKAKVVTEHAVLVQEEGKKERPLSDWLV